MTPPSFLIRIPLEAKPEVLCDFIDEAEELRIADWLSVHPEYAELVARALELQNETEAA